MTDTKSLLEAGLPKKLWWIITLLGLLVIFLLVFFSSRAAIETELKTRIINALATENIDWVSVDTEGLGRDVVLTGVAPSEEARDHAIDIARKISGVRVVDFKPEEKGLVSSSGPSDRAVKENDNSTEQRAPQLSVNTTVNVESNEAEADSFSKAAGNNGPGKGEVFQHADTDTSVSLTSGEIAKLNSAATSQITAKKLTEALSEPGFASSNLNVSETNRSPEATEVSSSTDDKISTITPRSEAIPADIQLHEKSTLLETGEIPPLVLGAHATTTTQIEIIPPEIQTTENKTMMGEALTPKVTTKTQNAIASSPDVSREDPGSAVEVCQSRLDAVMTNNTILFEFNSARIKPVSIPLLHQVINELNQCRDIVIEHGITVAGHVDNMGDENYNKFLSRRRVNEVKSFLVYAGIPPVLIKTVGFGASQPINKSNTAEGRVQNNRVVFSVGHN